MIMINDGQKSRHIDDTKKDISVTGKNPDIDIVKQKFMNASKTRKNNTCRRLDAKVMIKARTKHALFKCTAHDEINK